MPKHFDIDRWVDFVRDLAKPAERAEMENHLTQGCARCNQQVALLRGLSDSAAGIRTAPEPPEPVMERALAIFRTAPAQVPARRRRLIAELIFDSFAAPAMAGARGVRSGSRHLSYRAENFELDLLADFDRRSQTVMITGQLSDRGAAAAQLARVAVQLISGRSVLRQTETDEFGEFQFEAPVGKGLTLRVAHKAVDLELNVPLGLLWPSRSSSQGGNRKRMGDPPKQEE